MIKTMNKVQITFLVSSAMVIILLLFSIFMDGVIFFALIPAFVAVIAFTMNERK